MKNLVLVVCAVVALFAFSSCEKCLNCAKAIPECGKCRLIFNTDTVFSSTSCNTESETASYNKAKTSCPDQIGTWIIVTAASTSEIEVCGNSSLDAQDRAKPFQVDGYSCK